MTTNTPDTTRLSEEHVHRMLGATAFIDPPDAAKDVKALCHAYLTLAADLARVEAERDRYREALQDILDTSITNPRHDYGYMVWVNSHDQMVAIARTALNGGTDAE